MDAPCPQEVELDHVRNSQHHAKPQLAKLHAALFPSVGELYD